MAKSWPPCLQKWGAVVSILALILSIISIWPASTTAFNLGYHVEKTDRLCDDLGFSNDACQKLKWGNKMTDVESTLEHLRDILLGWFIGVDEDSVLKKLHFDDLKNKQAIEDNWKWLEDTFKKAIKDECNKKNKTNDDYDLILFKIGVLLHAVEDFYSHSNWVENVSTTTVQRPLPTWEDVMNPPAGGPDPYKPIRDDFNKNPGKLYTGSYSKPGSTPKTHDELNKDKPSSPQGSKVDQFGNSYFDLAFDLSVRASKQWMNKIKSWIDEDCWNNLKNYDHSWLYSIWLDIKEWGIDTAAKIVGKWRDGDPKEIIRPGITIIPSYDPLASYDSTALSHYTYAVTNTGQSPMSTLNLNLADGGASQIHQLESPPGWGKQVFANNIVFATGSNPISPGQTGTFGIWAKYSTPQKAQLQTDVTDPVDVIGPGNYPDQLDQEFKQILQELTNAQPPHKDISFSGGAIGDNIGNKIEIPAGALESTTTIYIFRLPDVNIRTTSEGKQIITVRDFGPSGFNFSKPVRISIPYTIDEVRGIDQSTLDVFYLNHNTQRWEKIYGALIDRTRRIAVFETTHFSHYGIGGSPVPTGSNISWLLMLGLLALSGGAVLIWRARPAKT